MRVGLTYDYELREGALLSAYDMEAQGELLADYFALKFLNKPEVMRQQRFRHQLALYESVLSHFLHQPGSRSNLPRGWALKLVPSARHNLRKINNCR